jgi:hypothetical protein
MQIKKLAALLLFFSMLAGCVLIMGRTLQHETVEEPEIDEASGLAASIITPGLLYTHNDSGGKPIIYVLNYQGLMPAKIALYGIKNRDWEDIATCTDPKNGKPYVYVGDIGDNSAVHPTSFIYRFEEPELADTLITIGSIERIEYVYADGPRDAEALFADPRSGDLYVISKREEKSSVYRLPYPQSTTTLNTAQKVATLPFNWVTAADISPNGHSILVKTYTNIYRFKRGAGATVAQALNGKYKNMRYYPEEQGEAIAWDTQGRGYFTLSERIGDVFVDLYYYK